MKNVVNIENCFRIEDFVKIEEKMNFVKLKNFEDSVKVKNF